MASGSSSSSMFPLLPNSFVPAEHNHHLVAPMEQTSNQPEPSSPDADVVVAVSPNTLLNGDRYVCKVCLKGFPRMQNLILHGRVHNLPFSLKTRTPTGPVRRKAYLCPEPTCQHHNRSHALGDFGGLKKHYLRKHWTQKNYKCDTCSKMYAAETDLKAHSKVCGKRRHICHRGARFARSNDFVAHQECCATQEHWAVAGHSPTLQIGDRSRKSLSMRSTSNNNPCSLVGLYTSHSDPHTSSYIGSTSSYAPTFNMVDNSMRSTSNDNPSSLIGLYTSHPDPHISAFQNLSKSYHSAAPDQSQWRPSGIINGNLMTDHSNGSNLGQIFPDFFSPSSTQQDQHKHQADFDTRFYTDLLMDKIPLDNVSLMEDYRSTYEIGEGSNSNSNGGVFLDQSSSHNLIPGVYNTSLNGMPNPVCGEGSSTFNQEFDGSYDQGSNYGYGDCNGQSDYGYGTEGSNFEASAATEEVVAPCGQILNQFRGFWF